MKNNVLLPIVLFLIGFTAFHPSVAQNYYVTSLATPGAAAFTSDKMVDGVISLPFAAATHTIAIETNQKPTVRCDADWLEASFADSLLTLTATENTSDSVRTATVLVRSKDFHPLPITVRQEARLVFAVISDTHVGNNYGGRYAQKISKTLQILTRDSKLDALAVVGDLTDGGQTAQYKEFVDLFGNDENFLNPVDNFLFMMGNHDNYTNTNSSPTQGQTNYKQGLKAFNSNKAYPLDQYVLIKGYPFITVSVLSGANNDDNSSNGTMSYPNSTLSTLRRNLKKAVQDAPGKPIFVFAHVAPRNTCYSTWADLEGAAWAMWRLNSVLNDYPQVVAFCGHSHYPLGDPRSIHQGANPQSPNMNYYTVINTASITYSEINPGAVEAGIHPEGFTDVTEGLILEEQANGDIEVRRYDTFRDVEIDPEHRWVLKAPFDGSMFQYADIRDKDDNPNNLPLRDGLPAPAFTKSAELTVDPFPGEVKVTFPQATDNECVFRYKLRLLKGEEEVQSVFVFSQFYLTTDMPEQLSYTFEGLPGNEKYSVEVVAYDSWDNTSAPLTATFTTLADDAPLPEPTGWWTFDNADELLAGTGVATLQGAKHDKGNVNVSDDLEGLGIQAVNGPEADNGAISVPVGSSLFMTSNLETATLSSYSFLMDIHVPDLSGYTSLYQNDLTNMKDGSLFLYNGTIGKNTAELGYNGIMTAKGWYRIVFVVRNNKVSLYLNGSLIGRSTSANAENWQMGKGLLFFADENGEEHLVEIADLRFWNVSLTNNQVTNLGSPVINNPDEEVVVPEATGTWTFDNSDNLLEGSGISTLQGTTHSTKSEGNVTVVDNLADAGIVAVAGPAEGNGAVLVPKGSSLLMTSNLEAQSLSTYTFLWDVRAKSYSSYIPLFQNDLTDKKDGSLFFNRNMVGLNAGGLGYHGSLVNGNWYRILCIVEDSYVSLYVNGVRVGASSQPVAQHWELSTGALFFADNDGEEQDIETAEIRFWDSALTDEQAQELGSPAGE